MSLEWCSRNRALLVPCKLSPVPVDSLLSLDFVKDLEVLRREKIVLENFLVLDCYCRFIWSLLGDEKPD